MKHIFEYDEETQSINARGDVLNSIWKLIGGEAMRRDRWWATYNAVLQGMLAAKRPEDLPG